MAVILPRLEDAVFANNESLRRFWFVAVHDVTSV